MISKSFYSATIAAFFLIFALNSTAPSAQQNHALIVQDPLDKTDVRGQIHLAFTWGEQLRVPRDYSRALMNIRDAAHRWTDLAVSIDQPLMLSSPRIHEYPILFFITDDQFELMESERSNLKEYIERGGFIFLDNPHGDKDFSIVKASYRKMLDDVLGSQGKLVPITGDHEIYHSFFDFDTPPFGLDFELFDPGTTDESATSFFRPKQVYFLDAIMYRGRCVGIYSDKGYIVQMSRMTDNDPQLRFAINLIVHALLTMPTESENPR